MLPRGRARRTRTSEPSGAMAVGSCGRRVVAKGVGAVARWRAAARGEIGCGLVAAVRGLLVGHGTLRFAGGKRSVGLQIMAVAVGTLSFLVAVYLVNMTCINELLAQRGDTLRVS